VLRHTGVPFYEQAEKKRVRRTLAGDYQRMTAAGALWSQHQ
jgi:hypothetical protein